MEQKLSHKKVNEKRFIRNIVFRSLYAFTMGSSLDEDLIHMIGGEFQLASDYINILDDEENQNIINKVKKITERTAEIDDMIKKNLVGWKIERLSSVDLALLRMSIYDLLYSSDVPQNVVISEAVLIATDYCDDKSKKFINGILSSVLTDINKHKAALKEAADN